MNVDSDTSIVWEPLKTAVPLTPGKVLNTSAASCYGGITGQCPVLVVLAAGKGTRFGKSPKCIQPVHQTPLARHTIDGFRQVSPSPVIGLVGYRYEEVSEALGDDNIYVRTDHPSGGTALAAWEAFCVAELEQHDPLMVIAMGDRIVPPSIFERLLKTHCEGETEAALTLLTATYDPPRNKGKGRILRDDSGRVIRIVEQRDIDAEEDELARSALSNLREGNCPLYVIRASILKRELAPLTNENAQQQYYITDIVASLSRAGKEIRTVTTIPGDSEYDILCSDVTHAEDLALLEGILSASVETRSDAHGVARDIAENRPAVQIAAIAGQLELCYETALSDTLSFRADQPLSIGIAGGRLRIAFMHPDMERFFGPAWQMPIGARTENGQEQIVVLMQEADDRRIHLYPMNEQYREKINSVPADNDLMYPSEEVDNLHAYEEFGTNMSETLLLSLGYFSDAELQLRKQQNLPLPPASLWVGSNMRRPFTLVANTIASLRTLRHGTIAANVQKHLGCQRFQGLRLVSIGNIPQGGFSSSSAMTVATKNALNALFDLGIPEDLLIHLASQAEYGTGVRAGSLDQATEQKGQFSKGTLISSNPRDNYCILGTYPLPADRFGILFPYSVPRDREAWQWSWGFFGSGSGDAASTTGEMRKLTGKAAAIAAILTDLPAETDFFKVIESDLLSGGTLGRENREWITALLRQIPLHIEKETLRDLVLSKSGGSDTEHMVIDSLFSGWRTPCLPILDASGSIQHNLAIPLRAIVGYLFAEVVRNFHLIHHPDEWISCVTRSQQGDCCFEINPARLPSREEMEQELFWEKGTSGFERMECWMEKVGAVPFDMNDGLRDADLAGPEPLDLLRIRGGGFFRGLALIDLVEAMLKRAFGEDCVAVRVNAAGQGDYFQVHIDRSQVDVEQVKRFIEKAFYKRFNLSPSPLFVEMHPGGGAVGQRVQRADLLPLVIRHLREMASESSSLT